MRKGMKSIVAVALSFAMIATTLVGGADVQAAKAKKPKLSVTKASITKGKTKTVTIKNAKAKDIKSVKWTTKRKKIATVKKSSKTKAKIKGVKKGTTTITCKVKVKSKKYTFKVKVTVKNKKAVVTPAPAPTTPAIVVPVVTPTPVPASGGVAEQNQPAPAIAKAVYSENFDNGVGKFIRRDPGENKATTKLTVSNEYGYGKTSLYVTDRKVLNEKTNTYEGKSWVGAQVSMKDCGAEPGKDYKIVAWVMSTDTIRDPAAVAKDKKRGIVLSKIAVNADGTESDDFNAANQCESEWISDKYGVKLGTWVKLEATVTMPADGDLRVYFETPGVSKKSAKNLDNVSYYIDSFSVAEVTGKVVTSNLPSIADAYRGLLDIGTALGSEQLRNSIVMADVVRQFKSADAATASVTGGSITMGNEMKPSSFMGSDPTFVPVAEADVPTSYKDSKVPVLNFKNVDEALKLAKQYQFKMRGHCLVWHQQTSDWFFREDFKTDGPFVSKTVMKGRLEWYIKTVLTHIQNAEGGDMIYCWDVVNEVFTDTGKMRNPAVVSDKVVTGQTSRWISTYGDDTFITDAFTFARTYADPDVELYYNDYNEYVPAKRDAIAALGTKLAAIKVNGKSIISGIGMQSHLACDGAKKDGKLKEDCSADLIGQAIDKFATTGLKVQVTELDITRGALDSEHFAQAYKDVFNVYLAKKEKLDKIIIWGISDESSWRKELYPTIFRAGFQPKLAFWELVNLGRETAGLEKLTYTEADYYKDTEVIG